MAKLAESERRQAEHDSEMQKVDEPEARRSSAAETMQASEAARALRASHLQACAHRPSRAGAEQHSRASPAPSRGSRDSARRSLSLVEGGNYSKRFSGALPDHMPPETTPQMRAAAARRYSARP
jgi:hypothetical protein